MEKFRAKKLEKEIISVRLPLETLNEIDKKSAQVGISRNELINQMINYALDNMEDNSEDKI